MPSPANILKQLFMGAAVLVSGKPIQNSTQNSLASPKSFDDCSGTFYPLQADYSSFVYCVAADRGNYPISAYTITPTSKNLGDADFSPQNPFSSIDAYLEHMECTEFAQIGTVGDFTGPIDPINIISQQYNCPLPGSISTDKLPDITKCLEKASHAQNPSALFQVRKAQAPAKVCDEMATLLAAQQQRQQL